MSRDREGSPRAFSPTGRALLSAVAAAIIPQGSIISGGGPQTIARLEALLAVMPASVAPALEAAVRALEWGAIGRYGRRFTALDPVTQANYLDLCANAPYPLDMAARGLFSVIKVAHFHDPQISAAVGGRWAIGAPDAKPSRVMQQVVASDGSDDIELEVHAVVVGTGAGGAVVAKELAELGYAVVMVEEGHYFTRRDFDGQAIQRNFDMFRDGGLTLTLGNAAILLPQGRTVGGTTTVNSGTCYRVPEWVLAQWRQQHGLAEFTQGYLDPYYRKVEGILQVERAREEHLGGTDHVIRRGCERLGYTRHWPLMRNAPSCDGQGVCCFGCPTDAKRSTNVSYVPMALERGAMVFSEFRVDRIVVERGRAVGVEALGQMRADGSRQRLRVRASAVVLSCGTIQTPRLLMANHLAGSSGQLGRNLSIHPAGSAVADFDEVLRGWDAIPQAYAIEDFHEEGILFEGGFLPVDVFAGAIPQLGATYVSVMERYNHLAIYGFLVADSSKGRVVLGPQGQPLIFYHLNRHDVRRLQRGIAILARIYLAAGAKRVFPGIRGVAPITSMQDVERLTHARLKASAFELSAYHPLGTAKLGIDPRSSVVNPDHQVHDLPGLYVVDGSSVPSSLGVNPMMTIMAMATRAAPRIGRAVEASLPM